MKAAFYEKEVTPPLDCYVPGHYKERLFNEVLDRLYAKALVIESGGETVAIVTAETCFMPSEMHEEICSRIEKYTPIKSSNVLVCVTHSHSGAPIADSPEIFCYKDKEYTNLLYRLMADCVILAYNRLADASIKYSNTQVDTVSFNRNYVMKDGSLRTNPGFGNADVVDTFEEIDHDLSILFFENSEGNKTGAIVNFACHLDCVDEFLYSGDYASIISDRLKDVYGKDFVTLFILGACGDINHFDIKGASGPPSYVSIGETLATAIIQSEKKAVGLSVDNISSAKEHMEIDQRILTNSELIDEVHNIFNASALSEEYRIRTVRNLLTYHATNKSEKKGLFVQCIKIGEALIYALPGEVYTAFGNYIKNNSPSKINFIATLSNCECGYIPTLEVFDQIGIYETKLCHHSCLVPEAGNLISEKALELAKKL